MYVYNTSSTRLNFIYKDGFYFILYLVPFHSLKKIFLKRENNQSVYINRKSPFSARVRDVDHFPL